MPRNVGHWDAYHCVPTRHKVTTSNIAAVNNLLPVYSMGARHDVKAGKLAAVIRLWTKQRLLLPTFVKGNC